MTNHSEHLGWRRQLLVMVAVLLGAMVLVVGLLPPQVARGQEQQQQQGQIPTPPQVAQDNEQQQELMEQSAAPPAQGTEQAQNQEQVLDKDPQGNEYVAGELLVTYEKGAPKQAKDEAPKKVGAKVQKDFPAIGVQHVSVPEVKNEKAQAARQKALELKKKVLEQAPGVQAVAYNYVGHLTMTTPTDPDYGQQWAPPKINAPYAWDTTRGSSSARVAILDSGMDMNHPDLTRKVVAQHDFANNDSDATDDVAPYGHGTLSAGIVAASMNNGQNGAGICPNCSLLVGKVGNRDGITYNSHLIAGIQWAADNKANVINISLGGAPRSDDVERAINYAWNKGVVVVAAAGNNGTSSAEFYPAAYPNVIAVAATDKDDKRAIYLTQPGSYAFGSAMVAASNAGPWVDVAAPGKGIYTTSTSWNSGCACYISGSISDAWGTSMAAPHVSGLAGLILSKDGSLSNAQVRDRIESTARDLGTGGKDNVFGHGRIHAQNALVFTSRNYEENDPAITYSGGDWTKYSWSGTWGGASGGYTNWASRAGATATFTFTGNSFSWWANKGSYGGRGIVFVDGAPVGHIVDHYATSNQPSQSVFTKSWPTSGTHTVKIKVEGTSGHPWVDVDRFSVTDNTMLGGW